MPRPGQTPKIRAGADAEHGTNATLARQQLPRTPSDRALGSGRADAGREPVDLEAILGGNAGPESDPLADLNDGFDEALFAPTDRPNEPIFAGVPFGNGPNYVRQPTEDDRTFMLRVADDLEAQGGAPKAYIEKIRRGV